MAPLTTKLSAESRKSIINNLTKTRGVEVKGGKIGRRRTQTSDDEKEKNPTPTLCNILISTQLPTKSIFREDNLWFRRPSNTAHFQRIYHRPNGNKDEDRSTIITTWNRQVTMITSSLSRNVPGSWMTIKRTSAGDMLFRTLIHPSQHQLFGNKAQMPVEFLDYYRGWPSTQNRRQWRYQRGAYLPLSKAGTPDGWNIMTILTDVRYREKEREKSEGRNKPGCTERANQSQQVTHGSGSLVLSTRLLGTSSYFS